jgi:O-antigen biosynthesis protein
MASVSVIIPTFQRPQRLWQALESVGQQTYLDVETIVVNNGGSSVEQVIERYEREFRRPIHYVTLRTARYIGVARNIGAATAQGEILALLDDDDRFRPTHLERLTRALKQDADAVVAYDDALLMLEECSGAEEASRVIASGRFGFPYEKPRFEQDDYILTSTLAIRRTAFDACGGFDRTLSHAEDWDLLLRLRDHGALLYVPGEVGIEYSVRLAANDHSGAVFDQKRRKSLDHLIARYALPPLAPKTFYDVARDFGCEFIPSIEKFST